MPRGLDNGGGGRRGQKLDEGLGGVGFLAVGGDGGGENQLLLQFCGE